MLLIYDGYRSHMTLRVLQHLRDSNVIVYALPAHTSGKTQPCDTGIFGVFKQAMNDAMQKAADADRDEVINLFELCAMFRHACNTALTRVNIMYAFERAGVYPVDRSKLMSVPKPRDDDDVRTLMSVDDMEALFQEKCKNALERILGKTGIVERRGFLDTRRGGLLTTQASIDLVRAKSVEYHAKCAEAARRAEEKEARARVAKIPRHVLRAAARPLAVRRQVARERTEARKTQAEAAATLANMGHADDEQ